MNKPENLPARNYIFGALFVAANRVETMLERGLKEFDVTAKQWFLSIVIDYLFEAPPTIKDAAKAMGSSHQNVKQLAAMLEKKGLLDFRRDPADNRAIRLRLSENSRPFWEKVKAKGSAFQNGLFEEIGERDLAVTQSVLGKMLVNLEKMEQEGRGDRK